MGVLPGCSVPRPTFRVCRTAAGLQLESISDAIGDASAQPRHRQRVAVFGNTGTITNPQAQRHDLCSIFLCCSTSQHQAFTYHASIIHVQCACVERHQFHSFGNAIESAHAMCQLRKYEVQVAAATVQWLTTGTGPEP